MRTARQMTFVRLLGVALIFTALFAARPLAGVFGRRAQLEAARRPEQPPVVQIRTENWQGTPEQVERFQKEVDAHNAEFERGRARQAATVHRAMVDACLIIGLLLGGWIFFELNARIRPSRPPRTY